MLHNSRPVANSTVVLREEFDDWAILFDPDSGAGFGLNPVSVFIWKRLDGRHTPKQIFDDIKNNFEAVPEEAINHLEEFIQDLLRHGFVGYELTDFKNK